jgi:colanic acid/amylovoran biosynthesis glycosyltransferase
MNRTILIFTDNFPFGKSETFFDTELNFIERSFEKVTLFPFEKGKNNRIRDINENTDVMKPVFNRVKNKSELLFRGIFNTSPAGMLLREGIRSEVWKSASLFRIWFTHFLIIRGILNEIKKRDLINFFNQFDVLYFYWGLRWSQILPFLPAEVKAKTVVRFHGSDLYEFTNNDYIPWRLKQLSRIDRAIVVSETGRKYIENIYPFLSEKIIVSRIGTNDNGLNMYHKSDTINIVSCSNLVPVKRVGLIVVTLAALKISANWIHFGDGPDMKDITKLCEILPANIKFEMKGAVTHDYLMNYFRTVSIDFFINVSSSEGVPVSIMEAMSFGIPVIATNVGGTSEIVSGRTGLLIDPDFSPIELAGKIEDLVAREDIKDFRTASRNQWEQISKADIVYPGFIEELLMV